ncbi:MAG: hypothetical protein GXP41_00505 [Chloroflexi bacterium]|nr:hypothetical protein [Chloroflexota bacterium]
MLKFWAIKRPPVRLQDDCGRSEVGRRVAPVPFCHAQVGYAGWNREVDPAVAQNKGVADATKRGFRRYGRT